MPSDAGAVLANGLTPQHTAEVNQVRIQAKMHRLELEARHAERRASMAEAAANQLYKNHLQTPMHVVQHLHTAMPPPPPPPAPSVVASTTGVTADSVAAAISQAMAADRRSVQELVERQGHSFKAAVQAAVAEHHAPQQVHRPESHSQPEAIQAVHKKVMKDAFKSKPKIVPREKPKAESKVESKAEALPEPQSAPQSLGPAASMPLRQASRAVPEPTKRAAEPLAPRQPPQPMPAKKRDPEKPLDESRPGPTQRKAETRRAARDLLDLYYKQNSGGGGAKILLDSARKSSEFILKTGHSQPNQRMNALDTKRSYDDILTQIEDFAKSRAGMSIADIEPIGGTLGAPRRRVVY